MDDGKLIILVQGSSVLYNQQHSEYRNNGCQGPRIDRAFIQQRKMYIFIYKTKWIKK